MARDNKKPAKLTRVYARAINHNPAFPPLYRPAAKVHVSGEATELELSDVQLKVLRADARVELFDKKPPKPKPEKKKPTPEELTASPLGLHPRPKQPTTRRRSKARRDEFDIPPSKRSK